MLLTVRMLQVQQLLTKRNPCLVRQWGKASKHSIILSSGNHAYSVTAKPVDLDGSNAYDGTI